MFVKICGVNSPAAVDAAVSAGVDAIGFVFASSPRRVSPRQAASLAEGLPPGVLKVAVYREVEARSLGEVLEVLAPDWVQADAASLQAVELPGGIEPFPVHRSGASVPARRPGRLLFEGVKSGSGIRADWSQARALAATTRVVLAGGLDTDNVADAIRAVRPWGVDVSSGVESEPGRKDPARIAAFVAGARAALGTQREEKNDVS